MTSSCLFRRGGHYSLFILLALALCSPIPAHADGSEVVYTMDEVVVTAQKREENAQVVPMSIQTFSNDLLEQSGARHLGDLAAYSPWLSVISLSPTQPTFSIRGIGRSDFTIGTDSAVGVFQDGVPLGGSGGALLNLSDISRVEVANGPQGALFGRNTTGGSINIIPNKPVAWTEGTILLRYGNFNKRLAEAVVNSPIADNLFFRGDALVNRRDGFYENLAGGDDLDTEGNETARGTLLYRPGAATEITFSMDYDHTNHDSAPTVSLNPKLSVGRGDAFGAMANDVEQSIETRDLEGYTLNVSHRIDNGLTIQSTTAYRHFATRNRQDNDGLADFAHYLDTDNIEKDRQFYQELRLDGKQTRFAWFFGTSFLADSPRQTHRVNTTTDSINQFLGAPLFPSDLYWQENKVTEGEFSSWSVYGDLTWHATTKLDLTVGLRYSYDDKDFLWIEQPNSHGNPFDIIFPTGPDNLPVTRRNTWQNWSPRFTAGYKVTDDLFSYFSVTQGYQAGGFGGLELNSEYAPETMINYEIGVKAEWLEKKLRTNLALFDYRYHDRQSLVFAPPSTPPPPGLPVIPVFQTTTQDIAGQGVEWEIAWLPTGSLKLNLNGRYSDIRLTHEDANLVSPMQVIAGLDYLSKQTLIGRYRVYFDYSSTISTNGGRFSQDQRHANARLTWIMNHTLGEVSFWVRNLSDEKTLTSSNANWQEVLDTTFITRAEPRTFGLDYRYLF